MSYSAIVIGAGDRGTVYGNYAISYPNRLDIIAVAEPDDERREKFSVIHKISPRQQYTSWESILEEKLADIAIITTPDHLHFDPAMKALELGYHIFLEKPMAPTEQQCRELTDTAEMYGRVLQVGHVLRFTHFFSTIHQLINSKRIGELVTISLRENVSYYHYAHSYIRGNWHNREASSPMILAKSCHDLDLLYWLTGSIPASLSSYGSQLYFGKSNQPAGAPERCTDGCPVANSCLYYAPRIYLDIVPILHVAKKGGGLVERVITTLVLKFPGLKRFPVFNRVNAYSGWPVSVISTDTSLQARRYALETGPYGRCVYDVEDHNVVDHQVVVLEFENKVTATFTLHGHSSEEGRSIRVDGTRGTLIGEFKQSGNELFLVDSLTNEKQYLIKEGILSGHGGGDENIMHAFVDHLDHGITNEVDARTALTSHLMAFAVDRSRLTGERIDFKIYTEQTK
jgi:predicted dehydrogenase